MTSNERPHRRSRSTAAPSTSPRPSTASIARAAWRRLAPAGRCWRTAARRWTPSSGRSASSRAPGIFGAGRGSALSEEGFIELDAGMMDGARAPGRLGRVGPRHPARDHARPARPREPVRRVHRRRRAPVRRAGGRRDVRPGRPRLRPRAGDLGGAPGAPRPELGRDDVRARHRRRDRPRPRPATWPPARRPAGCRSSRPAGWGTRRSSAPGLYADNTDRRRVDERPRRADHPRRPVQDRDRPDGRRARSAGGRRPGPRDPRAGQGPRRPDHPRSQPAGSASPGTRRRWRSPCGPAGEDEYRAGP